MKLLSVVALASAVMQADTTTHVHDMQMQEMQHHHPMPSLEIGGGWRLTGMGQVFPMATFGLAEAGSPLDERGVYLAQPVAMVNLESRGRRFVLRVTPNLEGLTLEDGELNFGGWGEGFIDSRHPHTILHEAMLSVNWWDTGLGSFSLSGGKGFAPYGTDDPMARPSAKYPTNHHLSQILERFTVNGMWVGGGWSVEAGVFGGGEPDGPWDFSNVESFADSWSVRAIRRFGPSTMGQAAWEVSASLAQVAHHGGESHGGEHGDDPHEGEHAGAEDDGPTDLFNTYLRFQNPVAGGDLYALAEYSQSASAADGDYWSFLAEAAWSRGRHTPYLRFERSIRPEYPREAATGDGFFRYDHDADPIGATAWSILSVGYGVEVLRGGVSVRPFVEAQLFAAAGERGGLSAEQILGGDRFAAVSVGARVFLGGDPMRMGMYGVRDPISLMGR